MGDLRESPKPRLKLHWARAERTIPLPGPLGFWLVYGGLGLALWLVFGIWVPGCQCEQKSALAKQRLHGVQLALERFAVDSAGSVYPRSIDELIASGYLPGMPENPFTGRPMRVLPLDAVRKYSIVRELAGSGVASDLSALDRDRPTPGDFAYYPRTKRGYSDHPEALGPDEVVGYTLELF